jgi:hypothetical protein
MNQNIFSNKKCRYVKFLKTGFLRADLYIYSQKQIKQIQMHFKLYFFSLNHFFNLTKN